MHVVAVRRDLIEAHPWVAKAAFDAYSPAKQLAYAEINQNAWYMSALPWIAQEAESTRQLMGDNYYSYGIGANRKTLEALLQYAHEQGLAKRKLSIEDVFHASNILFAMWSRPAVQVA
jgi:4,5-dihydroxyphthalate decarboxylase